jgi:CMP-N-acetylneuraminic acid synthetase
VTSIAIIPARGGSRRIPRKNIREFFGKPIIAYSIDTAARSGLFHDIIVSTDDTEIAAIANAHSAAVLNRPAWLAEDSIGTQRVAQHVLQHVRAEYDYACVIYPCAPLMTTEDLHEGYERLRNGKAPYVYTVGPDWQDAGQWYWGRVEDFVTGTSLDQADLYLLPAGRTCDINTEEDWVRAEQLYEVMHDRARG